MTKSLDSQTIEALLSTLRHKQRTSADIKAWKNAKEEYRKSITECNYSDCLHYCHRERQCQYEQCVYDESITDIMLDEPIQATTSGGFYGMGDY
jgi:putative ribosome biogenesis GTPase RsgA